MHDAETSTLCIIEVPTSDSRCREASNICPRYMKRQKRKETIDNRDANDFHDSPWRNLTTVNFNRQFDFLFEFSIVGTLVVTHSSRTKYENVSDDPITFLATDSHIVRFAIAIFRRNVSDTHRRHECASSLYARRHTLEGERSLVKDPLKSPVSLEDRGDWSRIGSRMSRASA